MDVDGGIELLLFTIAGDKPVHNDSGKRERRFEISGLHEIAQVLTNRRISFSSRITACQPYS